VKNKLIILACILVSIIVFFWLESENPKNIKGSGSDSLEFLSNEISQDFEKAIEIREFTFPEDYAAHSEYLTEWWYYTGNLKTEEGRHFGYQLTFFRRAIPTDIPEKRASDWATNQIYLAHFAITDTQSNSHLVTDQIARNANNLAGTSIDPYFYIWLNNWQIRQTDENTFMMKADADNFGLELLLENSKPEVLHGDRGLSQKGEQIGNASYYFSQTRLDTNGRLRIDDQWFEVSGFSWMDHEFGTSTLGANQVGWDWFSMQLDNQTEMMLFQIRNEDKTVSQFSSGTFIGQNGETTYLSNKEFAIEVIDTWKNPTGSEYPIKWSVRIEKLGLELEVVPVIKDQEMDLFFQYWEGAVFISGTMNGEIIEGFGYVELTGYAQSMQGVF